ncbi:MAG: hypothetical protein AAGD10_14030 [Myxococcota bacterium]
MSFALLTLVASTSVAQLAEPKQVVVLEAPDLTTKIELRHLAGDRVARLVIGSPPQDVIQALEAQLGSYMIGVARDGYVDGKLTLDLRLASDAVDISVDDIEEPRAFAFTFRARADTPPPERNGYFGRTPGLWLPEALPTSIPREPGDAPCAGNQARAMLGWAEPTEDVTERFHLVQSPECADHLAAELASTALRASADLGPFEVWAFRFDPRHPWPNRPRAFARAVLVAGEVLARTRYLPEAEVMLTAPVFKAKSLQLHQAIALANLETLRGRWADAENLLAPLSELATTDRMRAVALELRARAALGAGTSEKAMAIAESVYSTFNQPESAPARAFTHAGETALARGDMERARRFFSWGVRSGRGPASAAARIRLADIAAMKNGWRKASTLLARVKTRDACLGAHIRLRRAFLRTRNNRAMERTLTLAIERPACPSEKREAAFALTYLYMMTGVPEQAIAPARLWSLQTPPLFRNPATQRPLLREVSRAGVERLARHRNWKGIADLYQEHLAPMSEDQILDDETELLIADATHRLGLYALAGAMLKGVLAREIRPKLKGRVAALLTEAYAEAGDDYRAALVERYFATQLARDPLRWRVDLVAAALSLEKGQKKVALRKLEEARDRFPEGDPRFAWHLAKAKVEDQLGRREAAADSLVEALSGTHIPTIDTPGVVIRVLSSCVRGESNCARKLFPVALEKTPDLVTPRLRWQAKRMGMDVAPGPSDGLVDVLSAARSAGG